MPRPGGQGRRLTRWSFRPVEYADLPALLAVQEQGAIAGLSNVFPQETYPFPREVIRERWESELEDPAVAAYVATDPDERLVGFAARRADEVLHFGTAVETWGSGLAASYPRQRRELRLRVFRENRRARRFYEKLGWKATGVESRTSFPPHPTLLEYVLDRTGPHAAG